MTDANEMTAEAGRSSAASPDGSVGIAHEIDDVKDRVAADSIQIRQPPGPAGTISHDEKGRLLTGLARAAIARQFALDGMLFPHPAWLDTPGAVFVTLIRNGQLRGCIGSLEAHRPLVLDLQANAEAAAFQDPRFPPLDPDELKDLKVEVSLLSKPEPIVFRDEADALAQLRPYVDGVIFQAGWRRSTFLPQVWEQLPEPDRFMAHLKMKAGLPAGYWSDQVRLFRYTVDKFEESP